jgi:hypothetical protein
MRRNTIIYPLLFLLVLLAACAAPRTDRINKQNEYMLNAAKSLTVVPLRTDVYQISAGGVEEKMDEWCAMARTNVMTAINDELAAKPMILVKPFEESLLSQDQRSSLDQTKALYNAVNYSIVLHTYGPPEHRFQDKFQNFDYSLGEAVYELARDTDVLLMVSASDQIATAGRKALQAGSVILGALIGVNVTPNFGATTLSIALVDAETGKILWYNRHGSRGDQDLRDPIKTTKLVKRLMADFPIK